MQGSRRIANGDVLWVPSQPERSNLAVFQAWVEERIGRDFNEYADFWRWSVENIEEFWRLVCTYCDVRFHRPATQVLGDDRMPGATWFPGAELNYAEQVFRHVESRADEPAIIYEDEGGNSAVMSWRDFAEQTRRAALALKALGIGKGDRVAAYAPNCIEIIIAFQACASIGAIWTCSSPDFGSATVIDRFAQITPRLLIAKPEYSYGGRVHDRSAELAALVSALPSVSNVVLLPTNIEFSSSNVPVLDWTAALEAQASSIEPLHFSSVPFDHPLWVLYSSGTTGKPKAIVHGHGGMLVEHLKSHRFHLDLGPKDRFFWFTTTGWVMWNILVGGLLVGATIVLYDGNPAFPDGRTLWAMAERQKITYFGAGAAFLTACMKAGLKPGEEFDLSAIQTIGSTGSPLSVDAFAWCYDAVKRDVHVASSSGGTDIGSGFVGGIPTRPVRAGQLQGRMLGAAVYAVDESGTPVTAQVGEMVITRPMPSMPLFFWNDEGNVRYRESYFAYIPGVWRHGDFLEITPEDQCIIHGRSDSTLNRYGIRIGTAEIYRAIETINEVADSLIVNLEYDDGTYFMPLFVELKPGVDISEDLKQDIKNVIKTYTSPRHCPDEIFQVKGIPYTLTGKKMEVPVKRIMMGYDANRVMSRDAMRNPETIAEFEKLAKLFKERKTGV